MVHFFRKNSQQQVSCCRKTNSQTLISSRNHFGSCSAENARLTLWQWDSTHRSHFQAGEYIYCPTALSSTVKYCSPACKSWNTHFIVWKPSLPGAAPQSIPAAQKGFSSGRFFIVLYQMSECLIRQTHPVQWAQTGAPAGAGRGGGDPAAISTKSNRRRSSSTVLPLRRCRSPCESLKTEIRV